VVSSSEAFFFNVSFSILPGSIFDDISDSALSRYQLSVVGFVVYLYFNVGVLG
jgi:hypothetical protein